jgi:undecaprenyl-phosphate 4-deoxy-4-formamido-L-arabinose transferase
LGRALASLTTKIALRNVVGAEIARQVSAFRAFRRQVTNAFRQYEGAFVSIDVLLTWGTNRFAAVKVQHEARKQGASGYTFRKLVTHSMNMMTGFSTVPLQFASIVGFLFTLFGAGVLFYVIGRYFLSGDAVPGFPFLASIIAIFSGAQLFALGIIGEYLARMHFRMMDRPSYAIREIIGTPRSEGTT